MASGCSQSDSETSGTDMDKYTEHQRFTTYERLLHRLAMAHSVTLLRQDVYDLLGLISDWSYAHRRGNGELTDKEQQRGIDMELTAIDTYLRGER